MRARIKDIAKAREFYGDAPRIWARQSHRVSRVFGRYRVKTAYLDGRTLIDATTPVTFYVILPTSRLEELAEELEVLLGCKVSVILVAAGEIQQEMIKLRIPL